MDRIKKFYKDHEEVILFAIGASMASAVLTTLAIRAMEGKTVADVLARVDEDGNHRVLVTLKNGEIQPWTNTNPK